MVYHLVVYFDLMMMVCKLQFVVEWRDCLMMVIVVVRMSVVVMMV